MYAKGEGVPQNDAEAVKWYRKAAEQGYTDCPIQTLGIMYTYGTVGIRPAGLVFRVKGDNVLRDYQEAVKWYRKAAEQGDRRGQGTDLGVKYATGARASRRTMPRL